MKITCLPASLALCLAAACAPHVVTTPAPAPAAGERIRYATRLNSTEFIQARMVSLDPDSLIYERFIINAAGQSGQWMAGSLPTDSIAGLQVRVGRRGHAGRGAIIGGAIGLVAGIGCANQEPGWLTPTPEQCLASGILSGLATGTLIGLLIRSDVWAPTVLPARQPVQPPTPAPVTLSPVGIGLRLPIRLMSR